MAQRMDVPVIPYIWPIIYLAERKCLARHGYFMLGDEFVAMQHGPVPLRTYAELYLKVGRWEKVHDPGHFANWLKRLAARVDVPHLLMSFSGSERQCLQEAWTETISLGLNDLQKLVKGDAWQRAGPDGMLDPLEVAKEGEADAATLDFVLRWREIPYLMEAPIGISAY